MTGASNPGLAFQVRARRGNRFRARRSLTAINLLLLLLLVLLGTGCGGTDPVAATSASVPTETPDFLGRGALGPGTEGLLEITADPDGDLRGKLTVEGEGGPSGLRVGSYELVGRQNVISGTFVLQNAQEGSAHMVVTGHARADVLLHRYAVLNDGQIFPGWLRQGVQGAPRPDVEPLAVTLSEVNLAQLLLQNALDDSALDAVARSGVRLRPGASVTGMASVVFPAGREPPSDARPIEEGSRHGFARGGSLT